MVNSADILNTGILIVDDQEANVRLLEGMLRVAGYASASTPGLTPWALPRLRRIWATAP